MCVCIYIHTYTHTHTHTHIYMNDMPTANITEMEKAENFSSKIRHKTTVPTLTTSIQYRTRGPSKASRQVKKNKRHPYYTVRSKAVSVSRLNIIYRKP